MLISFFVFLVFALAIVFTWTNGSQHASAVAAGAIGSHCGNKRVLVILICLCEIAGTIFGGSAVADVIQSLSKWPESPTVLPILTSALLSAIVWNFFSRRIKIPSSSTHALLGGIIGALIAASKNLDYVSIGKFDLIHPSGLIGAVVSLFISPTLGFVVSYALFSLFVAIFFYADVGWAKLLRKGQWFATAALAFGDGQNDTQKTMGLLVIALNAAGLMSAHDIPIWMRILIGIVMGGGALWLSDGVVKELAFNVYKLRPMHALSSELSAAAVLVGNSIVGGPVSASQVIATSIMGAGTAERKVGIHWLIIKDILLSWLVTIPATALLAGISQLVLFQWAMDSLK